tara:strand:- start:2181 stop:2921 length:741 start_codon:yes stop_codon:yes gene_type:complete
MKSIINDGIDKENRKLYKKLSGKYDKTRYGSRSLSNYERICNESIENVIKIKNNMKLLDVATGTGRIPYHLSESGADITAIDLTEEMLERAKLKGGKTNIKFMVANARSLPFEDESFDLVTSIRFFHLLDQPIQEEVFKEMFRVAKPGGLIVFEHNNAFSGIFIGFLFDIISIIKKEKLRGMIWPLEVDRKFSVYGKVVKRGLWFTGLGYISKISYKLAQKINSLGKYFPFYWFTNQILLVVKKPN